MTYNIARHSRLTDKLHLAPSNQRWTKLALNITNIFGIEVGLCCNKAHPSQLACGTNIRSAHPRMRKGRPQEGNAQPLTGRYIIAETARPKKQLSVFNTYSRLSNSKFHRVQVPLFFSVPAPSQYLIVNPNLLTCN